MAQLMKSREAPAEATGYIRIRSIDKQRTERVGLGAGHTTHEDLRELVSDDRSERSMHDLDLEDPRSSMENV